MKLLIKTNNSTKEYTEVSPGITYNFDGIKGRYFNQINSYSTWIAVLEDGTLLSLYNGVHHPFNADYELIEE